MEETRTAETQERETEKQEKQTENSETVKGSEAEGSETVKGSEVSESSEAEGSEASESPEAATIEYGTSEGEDSPEEERQTGTETGTEEETETETEEDAYSGYESTEGESARNEAMSEFYSALAPDVTPQEYYAKMLGYADSINHVCTVTLSLCLAILLCAGIVAGSMIAHSFWSKFK